MVARPSLDSVLGRSPSNSIDDQDPPPLRGRRLRANSLTKGPAAAPPDADTPPRPSRAEAWTRLGRRSRSRPRSQYAPSSFPSPSAPPDQPPPFPHVSVFRIKNKIELHVWSQSVKLARPPGYEAPRSLPVFDTHSKINGSVLLDATLTQNPGRLTVSLEGAFVYISPPSTANKVSGRVPLSGMHRHVFVLSSMVVPVAQPPPIRKRRSNSSVREAFSATVASARKQPRQQQPTQPAVEPGLLRPFPFTLDVPPPRRQGEELPPTFSAVVEGLVGPRGRTYVERSEITYKLVATWEADVDAPGADLQTSEADPPPTPRVEAPIIFEPENDFESLDGHSLDKHAWLEVPLRPERPVPFTFAVAIPETPSFSRARTIPYYVVFTTAPRSAPLAREIVVDATITVALVRQVALEAPPASPSTPALSSSPASALPSPALTNASSTSLSSLSDDAHPPSFVLAHKTRLLKRMVNSAPPRLPRRALRLPIPGPGLRRPSADGDAPAATVLAPAPASAQQEGYADERTLYTDVYAGFPKRPKLRVQPAGARGEPGEEHRTLRATALLPDGLYKAQMQLHPQMIPTINWADLNVKYYLEVSVVFGQDESRARIPIRVT
ncbi:hypothetical protein DAEQUDRAFT_736398 [Daedalea quercina L-15889]|uniref:Uncharacterized protein n=1 Tax=Daedalea quercina L-15889 TaxID=1314783 RepID=A0A165SF22_9APHY|nr:hypothetical protein DAEQUDRAFT_736398 [Daedalea quercina L-15889]